MNEEYIELINKKDVYSLKEFVIKLKNENKVYQEFIEHNKKIINECNDFIIKNCNHEWVLDYENASIDKTYMICTKCGDFK
jgi:hypothetical protein